MNVRSYQINTTILIIGLLLVVPQVSFALDTLQTVLWTVVVAVFGTMTGLGGYLLNFAVTDYIVGFGYQFSSTGVGNTVDVLWVTIRDLFNLTFIFGLVFIGFKMILGSDDSGSRRWLIHLIMAALLVNFSLFITKFIVDFTNIAASQIAHAFPTTPITTPKGIINMVDISGAFMNAFGIQGIFDNNATNIPGGKAGYGYIFGALILFLVTAFVFAAGGLMILIRYAALCLYMIMSPLMFLGWVFPQLQSTASSYWRGFLGRAFFAPVYLLLVYFSYKVVAAFYYGGALKGSNPNYPATFNGGGNGVSDSFSATLPPFIISCVFLIAAIVVANKLSADGASTAMSLGKSATDWTKRKATNAAWGSARFARKNAIDRPVRRASNYVGTKLERQLGTMQTKGGVVGAVARSRMFGEPIRKSGEAMRDAKLGLGATLSEDQAKTAAVGTAARKRQEAAENTEKLNAAQRNYTTASASAANTLLPQADREKAAAERDTARAEMATHTKKLTDEELLRMDGRQLTTIAGHLSDKQIETLEKSGKFTTFGSDSDIEKLKKARGEDTFKDYAADLDDAATSADRLGEAIKGIADTVRNLSDERLTGMKTDQLKDEKVAMHLSNDQLKTLKASGKYSSGDMKIIEDARESGINKTITLGSVVDPAKNANSNDPSFKDTQRQNVFRRSAADVGSLPVSVFTNEKSFEYLTPAMLEARMKNGITNAEKLSIRTALEDHLIIPNGTTPQANVSSIPGLDKSPWTKWEKGNSVYAAQFFA